LDAYVDTKVVACEVLYKKYENHSMHMFNFAKDKLFQSYVEMANIKNKSGDRPSAQHYKKKADLLQQLPHVPHSDVLSAGNTIIVSR
jgi:hypothetical protein